MIIMKYKLIDMCLSQFAIPKLVKLFKPNNLYRTGFGAQLSHSRLTLPILCNSANEGTSKAKAQRHRIESNR